MSVKSIIKLENSCVGGIAAAGAVSTGDMILWNLLLLPPVICVYGAGVCWISIGMFAFHTIGWLLLSDRLKLFADMSDAGRRTLPDYFKARYCSRLLEYFYSVIMLIVSGIILAVLCNYIMKMIEKFIPSRWQLLLTIIICLIIFMASFLQIKVSAIIQSILLFAIVFLIIFMCVFMFLKYTPGEVLKLYNKCRLEGGTRDYLNIMYIEGRHLKWTEIVSMISIGCGVLGLPYLYTNAASVKTSKDIDKASIQGIINSGILIVSLGVMSLLAAPAIYPETVNSDFLFYDMVDKMAMGCMELEAGANIIKYIAAILIIAVLIMLSAVLLKQMLIIVKASLPKWDIKKAKHNLYIIMDIAVILFVLAVEVLLVILADPGTVLFKAAWGICQSVIAAPFILSVLWDNTTRTGVFTGAVSGAFVYFFWYYMPVSEAGTLMEITGMSSGLIGFLISFIICIAVSIFTKRPDEKITNILKKVRLERQ